MLDSSPLDKLEIEITSSSQGAEKKVNALADALGRLSNMSSLKGIEDVAKKITALGDASQKVAVTVDPSSDKALDGVIDKVGVLHRAIEKVNSTAIKVPSLSAQTGKKSASTTQTDKPSLSASNQLDALDILNVLAFWLGLENLRENREQSAHNDVNAANEKQAALLLDSISEQFEEVKAMLAKVIDLLEAK